MSHFIELSTKNFEDASKINGKDEFCFIIGDHKIFCHNFVASFISRKVTQLLLSDPTTNKFHIQIEFQDKKSKYEQNIIQFFTLLLKGKRIEINEETINEMKEELRKISESNKELEYYNTLIYSYLSLITEIDNEELKRQFYKL